MAGCRSRNDSDGRMRQVRGDKLIKHVEKQYDIDLGVRGDMKLKTALRILAYRFSDRAREARTEDQCLDIL
ncbi:hypothetical protein A2947_03245 [Candidatus Peribacteria bacterium RIFCSPLOWO2_01_FULL_54_110]|nr:MAG: hypothetical protein A2947_03245 [Candidatus Peribacteria bacterium RIFCSPLOWO2_01_FULL_54_110]